jgi:phosphoserine aminotransferase
VTTRPTLRPACPNFSSGPCAKRPGWSVDALAAAMVGRSHRAEPARARIQEISDRSRAILGIPADWRLGVVPASDTGAVEMALWSLLGPRGVDCAGLGKLRIGLGDRRRFEVLKLAGCP